MSGTGVTKVWSVPGIRRLQFDCLHSPELERYGALSLYQLGDISCDSGFVLSPHAQRCYEISYVVSGKGWFASDGIRFDLQPGDIYLGKPGEIHQGGADAADPFRYFYFGFLFEEAADGPNPFQHIKNKMDRSRMPRCKDRLDIRTPFVNAFKELGSYGRYSHTMIQVSLEQILVLTYRNFFSDWEAHYPADTLDNGSKRAVYAAIHYIDDRLLRIKDLGEVSDAVGYSLSYLSHLFVKEIGVSLRSYYTKKRWQKATELLGEGKHNITELAGIMQYESIHTFSRAFRKAIGLSPTAYMRHCMAKRG